MLEKKTPSPAESETLLPEAQETPRPKKNDPAAQLRDRIGAAQTGSYLPKESERGIYHVKLDKPAFDPKSGKKLSKEFIQKFTLAEWNQFNKNSQGLGYTVEIMWNPELFQK